MIEVRDLPDDALLAAYCGDGGYADCYATVIPRPVALAEFVTAFYTTPLFRVERAILRVVANRPSTDDDARAVASGARDAFAAWTVEARAPDQLLLCDFLGRTRSYFRVERTTGGDGVAGTRLSFGSAVVPRRDRRTGASTLGTGFRALLGFHRCYSRALLGAARARLLRAPPP